MRTLENQTLGQFPHLKLTPRPVQPKLIKSDLVELDWISHNILDRRPPDLILPVQQRQLVFFYFPTRVIKKQLLPWLWLYP